MKDWTKVRVNPQTPILETLRVIDAGQLQIALVVGPEDRFLGTVTDGDVRRGMLKGIPLDAPVSTVMNANSTVVSEFEARSAIVALMRARQLRQVPVLNEHGVLVGLECIDDILSNNADEDTWVVLMAGGRGTRLGALTDACPKPLLKVAGKPLLETIVQKFLEQGFKRFYMAVNYKAEMVRSHFGDGSAYGAEIRYLEEEESLGTAGALTLLPQKPKKPLIVMNADLITTLDFRYLLRFHAEEKAAATMCVRQYEFQVPYGVVQLNGSDILSVEEKPIHRFFVNAGIYVLSPEVIDAIPDNTRADMPTVIQLVTEGKGVVRAFPVPEYWIDIGKIEDYQRAQDDALTVHSITQHLAPNRG